MVFWFFFKDLFESKKFKLIFQKKKLSLEFHVHFRTLTPNIKFFSSEFPKYMYILI